MVEMTPEMEDLRRVAGHLIDIAECSYARRVDRALRAWEADRAQATVVLRAYNLARAEILNLHDAIDGKTHLRDASRAAEEEKHE